MGVDYYASAVIGCEVTGKLHVTVLKPRCSHVNAPGAKFCAECGVATAPIEVKEPIPGYTDESDQIGELALVHTTDDERTFVGVQSRAESLRRSGFGGVTKLPFVEVLGAYHRVKAVLEPLGLWDEASFGLWSVLYCSY